MKYWYSFLALIFFFLGILVGRNNIPAISNGVRTCYDSSTQRLIPCEKLYSYTDGKDWYMCDDKNAHCYTDRFKY